MVTLHELQQVCLAQTPELLKDEVALLKQIDLHIGHESQLAAISYQAWLSSQLNPARWEGRDPDVVFAESLAHTHFAGLFQEWKRQLKEVRKCKQCQKLVDIQDDVHVCKL